MDIKNFSKLVNERPAAPKLGDNDYVGYFACVESLRKKAGGRGEAASLAFSALSFLGALAEGVELRNMGARELKDSSWSWEGLADLAAEAGRRLALTGNITKGTDYNLCVQKAIFHLAGRVFAQEESNSRLNKNLLEVGQENRALSERLAQSENARDQLEAERKNYESLKAKLSVAESRAASAALYEAAWQINLKNAVRLVEENGGKGGRKGFEEALAFVRKKNPAPGQELRIGYQGAAALLASMEWAAPLLDQADASESFALARGRLLNLTNRLATIFGIFGISESGEIRSEDFDRFPLIEDLLLSEIRKFVSEAVASEQNVARADRELNTLAREAGIDNWGENPIAKGLPFKDNLLPSIQYREKFENLVASYSADAAELWGASGGYGFPAPISEDQIRALGDNRGGGVLGKAAELLRGFVRCVTDATFALPARPEAGPAAFLKDLPVEVRNLSREAKGYRAQLEKNVSTISELSTEMEKLRASLQKRLADNLNLEKELALLKNSAAASEARAQALEGEVPEELILPEAGVRSAREKVKALLKRAAEGGGITALSREELTELSLWFLQGLPSRAQFGSLMGLIAMKNWKPGPYYAPEEEAGGSFIVSDEEALA